MEWTTVKELVDLGGTVVVTGLFLMYIYKVRKEDRDFWGNHMSEQTEVQRELVGVVREMRGKVDDCPRRGA